MGAGATGFVTAVVAAGAGGRAGACALAAGGTGGRAGGGAFGGAGGAWPNDVNASVTEKRLTSSSVFIGLIGKFFPARFSDEALFILNELSASRAKLSRLSFRRFRILAEPQD